MLQQLEPMLSRLSGYTTTLVEAAGTPLSRLFNLDLSDGRCHRADCLVCSGFSGRGGSRCKIKSVVYMSNCTICKKASSQEGQYIGETARSLYERSREHVDDAIRMKPSSHIWKHWSLTHPEELCMPRFEFKVVKSHNSCLDRQIHEAIKISIDGVLNAKSEYRQNMVKWLSVWLYFISIEYGPYKPPKSRAKIFPGTALGL